MSLVEWEPIDEFASPGEFQRFLRFLEGHIALGDIIEIPMDPSYGRGALYGGRWFCDANSHEIWRLIPPDFPFRGVWERVRPRSG